VYRAGYFHTNADTLTSFLGFWLKFRMLLVISRALTGKVRRVRGWVDGK
jgi:hypothetical protein